MSLELKQVSVRLPEDAYRALKLLADCEEKEMGEKAREMLTRALLGEAHALRLQAKRLAQALATVRQREGDTLSPTSGAKPR